MGADRFSAEDHPTSLETRVVRTARRDASSQVQHWRPLPAGSGERASPARRAPTMSSSMMRRHDLARRPPYTRVRLSALLSYQLPHRSFAPRSSVARNGAVASDRRARFQMLGTYRSDETLAPTGALNSTATNRDGPGSTISHQGRAPRRRTIRNDVITAPGLLLERWDGELSTYDAASKAGRPPGSESYSAVANVAAAGSRSFHLATALRCFGLLGSLRSIRSRRGLRTSGLLRGPALLLRL